MKYLLFTIGLILGCFGLIMLTGSLIIIVEHAGSGRSLAAHIIFTTFMGILPLIGGILLCVFAFKKPAKQKETSLIENK